MSLNSVTVNEAQTRALQIDPQLLAGDWRVTDRTQVRLEVPVDGYDAEPWNGVTDYCLYEASGNVLAVVEAKRCSRNAREADEQLRYYVTEIAKPPQKQPSPQPDTVIVPAQKEGYETVFLGQDCWYAIRISGGMLDKINYIAAYQTQPVSAPSHCSTVAIGSEVFDPSNSLAATTKSDQPEKSGGYSVHGH